MSRHLTVRPWLSDMELVAWMQEADSRAEYQRRLSVWLARLEPWPAHRIARTLGVSEAAIWKWLGQYNRQGPGGLERQGRGGRRWAFLSLEEEDALLAQALEEAGKGRVLTAKQLLPQVQAAVGHPVTPGYVYRLLHRHGWRKLSPRPGHVKSDPQVQEAFKKGRRNSSKPR
jgi:transposase